MLATYPMLGIYGFWETSLVMWLSFYPYFFISKEMKRENLVKSREYIISQIQLNLLNLIGTYKENKKLKDYQLAEELGVSKGYVSQILHSTFDHKISKIVDLALACNTIPLIYFVDLEQFVNDDAKDKLYVLIPVARQKRISKKRKK